jgi:hypothetical protein
MEVLFGLLVLAAVVWLWGKQRDVGGHESPPTRAAAAKRQLAGRPGWRPL